MVSVSPLCIKCCCMVSVSMCFYSYLQALAHGLREFVVSQVLVHGVSKYVFLQLSTSIGAWSP